MGLIAKSAKKVAEQRKGFEPLELSEGNVQAIFNLCLAIKDTPDETVAESILFSRTLGYKPSDEIVIRFDKQKLLDNQKNIKYLYGQLKDAHQGSDKVRFTSAVYNYSGKMWTDSKAHLLELLYMGCTPTLTLISPFYAEEQSALLANTKVTPTLSPKDPAFPAWWETNKAEWEQ